MPELPKHIKTIELPSEFKFKEKGSLFIAKLFPVNDEETAVSQLKEIRKEFYDASHHCYSINLADGLIKYSDDGEPNGTAGIRINNAIDHFNLKNVLLIVVRYFGGTKLGVGPLGKAYYDSSIGVLSNSNIVEKTLFREYTVEYKFEQSNFIHKLLSQNSAQITSNNYENKPTIEFLIPEENVSKLSIETHNPAFAGIIFKPINSTKYL